MRHALPIDSRQWARITDVVRVEAAAQAARVAAARYATVLAGVAAELVQASLPSAHTLMFAHDIRDGATDITMMTIRDDCGALLWHGADFYQPSPAELTAGIALLDDAVVEEVTTTIQQAYDTGHAGFTTVTAAHPDLLRLHLLELNIPDAVRRGRASSTNLAAPIPDTSGSTGGADPSVTPALAAAADPMAAATIDVDLLAVILARETSVMDPDDVPALMVVIRAEAGDAQAPPPAR